MASVSASEAFEKAARDYAVALGVAFQIKDDILDYAGTEAVGKPLGADILEHKITMPLLGALKQVDPAVAAGIRKKIEDITGHPEYRDEMIHQLYYGTDNANSIGDAPVVEATRAYP